MASLGDIAKREDRTFTVGPFDTAPDGFASHTYAMGFRSAKSGADLVTIAFGAGEYNGDGTWTVVVPSASSGALSVGMVYFNVWRTGTGTKKLLMPADTTVMVVEAPGNA